MKFKLKKEITYQENQFQEDFHRYSFLYRKLLAKLLHVIYLKWKFLPQGV